MSAFNEVETKLSNMWEGIENSKVKQVQKMVSEGKFIEALKLAGKFRYKKTNIKGQAIIEGREALLYPDMYRQLKKDPKKLVEDGLEALKDMFKMEEGKNVKASKMLTLEQLNTLEETQKKNLHDYIIRIEKADLLWNTILPQDYGKKWGVIDDGRHYLFIINKDTENLPTSYVLSKIDKVCKFSLKGGSDLQLRKGEFVEFWFFIKK